MPSAARDRMRGAAICFTASTAPAELGESGVPLKRATVRPTEPPLAPAENSAERSPQVVSAIACSPRTVQ